MFWNMFKEMAIYLQFTQSYSVLYLYVLLYQTHILLLIWNWKTDVELPINSFLTHLEALFLCYIFFRGNEIGGQKWVKKLSKENNS